MDPGDASDFEAQASDPYEGSTIEIAKATFASNQWDWDTFTPDNLKWLIGQIKNGSASSSVITACYVFCDAVIPATYRTGWVLALLVAADRREEENLGDDDDDGED